ncbi:MAG: METTL5 family protein [Thermofilaceae archaeon]
MIERYSWHSYAQGSLYGKQRPLRKKILEILISRIPSYPQPRVELEQYVTPPHLASRILWIAAFYHDLEGTIIDLGAGTGRLGLGAAILGAPHVILVDIDAKALRVALAAARSLGVEAYVDTVCVEASKFEASRNARCVIQNPPFGVHKKGVDIEFLRNALRLAPTVFSIHKVESLDYVLAKCKEMGYSPEILFEEVIRLPPTMSHHRKKSHKVRVAAIRVSKG